jgi:hypothetical protein
LKAVSTAPLNILHLHGEKVYPNRFLTGGRRRRSNYSSHGTGVGIADARVKYVDVIMAGIDERDFRKLSQAELREQMNKARQEAGNKFVLAPGCSVPNESTDTEMLRLTTVAGA